MLLPLVVFVVVLTLVFGGYWALVLHQETGEQKALRKRLKAAGIRPRKRDDGFLQETRKTSEVPVLDAVLLRSGALTARLQLLVDHSGLKLTVGQLLLMCGGSGFAVYALFWYFTPFWSLGIVLGLVAACIPYFYVHTKATQRMTRFEELFPEAIDLLARALKAGHAFTTGLAMVADEMADPIGPEFRLVYDRQNFGMPLADALREFARRIPIIDARFFVTAVLTQREAGGNLAEVLENLGSVIRDRFKVKRQVRVVTAHARITGWVLAGLPPCAAIVMFAIVPDHMKLLMTDPLGVRMVVVGLVLQVIGTLIIKRLVNVEY